MCVLFLLVFVFKQKTAYEMRISDWSSDVCSSDLGDLDCLLDALLERHRVGAGGHVAQAVAHHRPGQDGGGGGAVTGDVVGLLRDLLDELRADLLVGVLELELLGAGHDIVGDRGRDRKNVWSGKSGSVRVDMGGRGISKKTQKSK